jgi:hypothetical protein
MFPETVFAMLRISEMNRERSHPMTMHRHEATKKRYAAGRVQRRDAVNRIGRAFRTVLGGQRIRRTAPAA